MGKLSLDSELSILRRNDEIMFESKDGLRYYAGVAQIAADSLFAATQLLRRNVGEMFVPDYGSLTD